MYRRTLEEFNEEDRKSAHFMFQCVATAFRPLRIEELTEFIAIDFTARPIPKFYEHRRQNVLSKCSNLLSVDDSSFVHFLDPSVTEYLMSPHLSDVGDTIPPLHGVMTPAHTRAAQACLGILLHLDINVTRDSLQEYPLAEYAAEHWADHARFDQQDIEDALKRLFDPSKQHLAVSVWIHDPVIHPWRRTKRAERPAKLSGTPLHYAALYGLQSIVKFLIIECAQNVHSRGFDDESTPLHVASSCEVADILLYHGADVTAQDEHGWTPLHQACRWGHEEVAHILLEHGANVTAQNKLESTPLHHACRWGHNEVARILLEHGANPKAQGRDGWTPLHEASSCGHIELVGTLIEHGADVRTQDRHGWTPYRVALYGKHVELARMLLKHGADAKVQGKRLSLHETADEGYVHFARFLLERGADATVRDEHRSTPLHKASEEGHVEVVFLLLEHRADATAQDKHGLTPLHHASGRGHVDVTRTLLKHGADARAQDRPSWTPLHHSCVEGHVEVARVLLENQRVLATAQDTLGWTPLHGASFGGHVELTHFLLGKGAKVKAHDKQGWTPLHQACGRGHAEVARILLENGADVGAKDNQGWTPLHRALSMGDVDVARVLLKYLDYDTIRKAEDKDGRTPMDYASPRMFKELPQLCLSPLPETSGTEHCCTMQ